MIAIEWANDATCDNCGKEHAPHCAQITIEDVRSIELCLVMLCSDCVEDVKKRLS